MYCIIETCKTHDGSVEHDFNHAVPFDLGREMRVSQAVAVLVEQMGVQKLVIFALAQRNGWEIGGGIFWNVRNLGRHLNSMNANVSINGEGYGAVQNGSVQAVRLLHHGSNAINL